MAANSEEGLFNTKFLTNDGFAIDDNLPLNFLDYFLSKDMLFRIIVMFWPIFIVNSNRSI